MDCIFKKFYWQNWFIHFIFLRAFTTKSQWYCAHSLWNAAKLHKTHQKERNKEEQKHSKRTNEGRLCVHVSVLSQRKVERNKGIMGKRQGGHEWEGIEKFFSSTRAETEAGRNDVRKCSRRRWFCHLVSSYIVMEGKKRLKEEGEGQKLAATVLCHCFGGFCVIVDSLLLFIVCVCLCLG